MKRSRFLLFTMFVFVFGCATGGAKPQKTQLQIREFQTRTYETNDVKMVMKAVLHVLQDNGFMVKNAVVDLGLLTAEKEVDVESQGEAFFATFFAGAHARWKKANMVECTANVSEFGETTRVRVNFQTKIVDNRGGIMKIDQIEDPVFYQNFFAKVDKGIFIQKEKL